MSQFSQLNVWKIPGVKDSLSWYYGVATGLFPPKYLIASKISVQYSPDDSLDSLWNKHLSASQLFLGVQEEVYQGEYDVDQSPTPEQSLLDLTKEIVIQELKNCTYCSFQCGVDRRVGADSYKLGVCGLREKSRVSSFFAHMGEELVFRGVHGSGTIFFNSCNMRCVFCQNGDISRDVSNGHPVNSKQLVRIMKELHRRGCHNINFVGGDPVVHLHTIVQAIHQLAKSPIHIPLLWNSNFFIEEKTLLLLRVIMDVWLPDLKFYGGACSRRLSKVPHYFQTVSSRLANLYNWGESFVIRHLVLPNHVDCCSKPILKWIKDTMPRSLVNIMGQYHPDSLADPVSHLFSKKYVDISRRLHRDEFSEVIGFADMLDLNFRGVTYY